MRKFALGLAALALVLAGDHPAEADWLSRLIVLGEKTGAKTARRAGGGLEEAAAVLKTTPVQQGRDSLAATVGHEGHWTFINRAGERITAANADELNRAFKVLSPDAKPDGGVRIILSRDAVLDHPARLAELPKGSSLTMAYGGGRQALPLSRRSLDGRDMLMADLDTNLSIAITSRKAFEETAAFLNRRIDPARLRLLSLTPGGPQTLPRSVRLEPGAKAIPVEPIDPYKLAGALGSLRGQTVFVSGRLEKGLLHFRSASGGEQTLIWKDLTEAAAKADVTLILLASSTARQPGTRNWAFLRVEVAGLALPPPNAVIADVMKGVAGTEARLVFGAVAEADGRVAISAVPVRPTLGEAPTSSLKGILSGVVSDLAGRVITDGIQAEVPSAERARELDSRLIPGIPSAIQLGYLGSLVLGLIGAPVSRNWWSRLWPREQPTEYRGRIGFWSARLMRSLAFILMFAPLVSPIAAPLALVKSLLRPILAPFRWIADFIRRRRGTQPST